MIYHYWETTGNLCKKRGERYLECLCVCGTLRHIREIYLKKGVSKSCGCKKKELLSKARTTHGRSRRDQTYNSWAAMKQRCGNSNHGAFHNYGGRGISVCKRWSSFEAFLQDMGQRPSNSELDRKNNSKNYSKDNCRWVTRKDNLNNTRKSKFWVVGGITYDTMAQACEKERATKCTILRWCNGWTDKRSGKEHHPKKGCSSYLKY